MTTKDTKNGIQEAVKSGEESEDGTLDELQWHTLGGVANGTGYYTPQVLFVSFVVKESCVPRKCVVLRLE